MRRFFLERIEGDIAYITGSDARHIARVLHIEPGRELVGNDTQGQDYTCRVESVTPERVTLRILDRQPCQSECPVPVRLFQAVPKGDKLEFVVQKAVELGAVEITPVLTSRCISRPSHKAIDKKQVRLQRIAYEAAKQSGRGLVPQVSPLVEFEQAVAGMRDSALPILLYEECETPLREILAQHPNPSSVALLVGSEGGFSQAEAAYARENGVALAGLGPRILRCETAPICALSVLMYHLGEF